MQRWFFLEDPENDHLRNRKDEGGDETEGQASEPKKYPPRKWLFRVRAPELQKDEVVCVVGSVPELGEWQHNKCIPLEQEKDSEIWSKVISIPDKQIVQFRFCVCIIVELGVFVMVRTWETHIEPRTIGSEAKSPTRKAEPEMYGCSDNSMCVDKGWLNKETVIQIQLFNDCLNFYKPKYARRKTFIKVTPVNLKRHSTNIPKTMAEVFEESLSTDTHDTLETPLHAYTEVGGICSDEVNFLRQPQFGKQFKGEELMIYQSTVVYPQNIGFLIDLFTYGSRSCEDDPPYHTGYSYILPSSFQGSNGQLTLPVTSTKHRPLGEITLRYLIIRPLQQFKCDMKVSYQRHWKKSRNGLDVGHRGCGSSYKIDVSSCSEVRENTIASLKTACEHGADFVEFDVQLSKDLVPIVYHDYYVCISMKKKKDLLETDMLELPLKELTLEQLRLLQVYHLTEGKSKNPRYFDEELEGHQPFPTLQQVLEVLDPHVGLNIELKWSMQYKDGSLELVNPFEINMFLDIILRTVLIHGGNRRVVFSCFNPDICAMVRMKQNKYPIMFLTQGQTERYQHYSDPRCWTIEAATRYSQMIEILGIVVHTEDLLKDSAQIQLPKASDLVLFSWGDDNADPGTIRFLKDLGLHGIIYDKINQYSAKETKESIFLVEARESQKDLLRLAAANAELERTKPSAAPPAVVEKPLDVERARYQMDVDAVSTATLLESLESRMSVVPKDKDPGICDCKGKGECNQ